MLVTEAELYLPLSEAILSQIISSAKADCAAIIARLTVPEIATLLLLQNLAAAKTRATFHPERLLAALINQLNTLVKKLGLAAMRTEVVATLMLTEVAQGSRLLPVYKIALLDESTLSKQNYLTSIDAWDYTFKARYYEKLTKASLGLLNTSKTAAHSLTFEQTRIYREISAQTDDHFHVQGYAGTGKSFLISHLIQLLSNKRGHVLILAERQLQLNALLTNIRQLARVSTKTFAKLAYEIIMQTATQPINRSLRNPVAYRSIMTDNEIIEHFDLKASYNFSPHVIVKAIRQTLAGFCYSSDDCVQLKHIPKHYAAAFDCTTQQIVLHFAAQLWQEMLSPTTKAFNPPIMGYHRIKWVALNGGTIPTEYTHILIDECHNLSKPIRQILDRSLQAIISLGDEYQNLQYQAQQRANTVRQRIVVHSIRSGRLLESIVNPIIALHPGKNKAPFHGNQLSNLTISYYDKPQVLAKPAAILVNSMWELFAWAQRAAAQGLELSLLTHQVNLTRFVNDCIDLYQHQIPPRHSELFRFKIWAAVTHCYQDKPSFHSINKLLSKQYSHQDWQKTSSQFVQHKVGTYALGRVEDVRNYEFDAVMLTPEVVSPVWDAKPENIGAIGSTIYIAVTRAKQNLIVPATLRNWLENISA